VHFKGGKMKPKHKCKECSRLAEWHAKATEWHTKRAELRTECAKKHARLAKQYANKCRCGK